MSPTTTSNQLEGVDVTSAIDIWTDERGFPPVDDQTDRVLHWDGRKQRIAYDFPGYLQDIAAVSPRNVWAVGRRSWDPNFPRVAHWNGKSWHVQRTPFDRLRGTTLNGASALSSTEIWAVGVRLVARYSC